MHDDDHEPGRSGPAALGSSGSALLAGLAMSDLDLDSLWVAFLALGGTLSRDQLRDTLSGRRRPSTYEHDLIAQALNDFFTEHGQNHPVAYSDELDPSDLGDARD